MRVEQLKERSEVREKGKKKKCIDESRGEGRGRGRGRVIKKEGRKERERRRWNKGNGPEHEPWTR